MYWYSFGLYPADEEMVLLRHREVRTVFRISNTFNICVPCFAFLVGNQLIVEKESVITFV